MRFFSGHLIWIPLITYFVWKSFTLIGKKKTLFFLLFLFLTVIASDVTSSYIFKNIFLRFRPCREEHLKSLIYMFGQRCGGQYGFASSHAANSFAVIFFSIRALNLKRFYHLLWILPILVSYSRIYLGAHYPGDILGGIIIGLIWGFFFSWIFKNSMEPDDIETKHHSQVHN